MKDIHNNPLFTDITAEEEVSVQGGGFWDALVTGGSNFWNWASKSGNGFILSDNKGTSADWGRMGDPGTDVPYGWKWGVRDGGRYIVGGYGNTGSWIRVLRYFYIE